jgi:long-subunit fatty acid transport protein
MRFVLIFLFSLIIAMDSTYAQKTQDSIQTKSKISDKLHFGGGFQLSFGNKYTAIGISPSVIYELTEKWASGMSVSYLYVNDGYYNYNYNIFGGSTLVMYNPIEFLQLNTEFEMLNVHRKNSIDNEVYWVPALYVGAGYAISKYGTIGVRYDFLWDENKSIYKDALTPYVKFYF